MHPLANVSIPFDVLLDILTGGDDLQGFLRFVPVSSFSTSASET